MSACGMLGERIDAFVDGTATAEERVLVEAHLATCASCRAEAEGIARLVERARRLPREMNPSRDRWTELRRHVRQRRPGRWSGSPHLVRLAAAVAIAATLSSAVTFLVVREDVPPRTPVSLESPVAISLARLDRQYGPVTRDLSAELEARRASLSPHAIATVERSLVVIDRAIAEARAALEQDPDNATLARMLAASYEHKLDLLRRAASLSAEL